LVVRVLYGLDPHNNIGKLLHKNVKKGRFLMFQTVHLECHQQRSFTLKMHQIVDGWGFAPDPTGGAFSAPQTP